MKKTTSKSLITEISIEEAQKINGGGRPSDYMQGDGLRTVTVAAGGCTIYDCGRPLPKDWAKSTPSPKSWCSH